MTPDMRNANMTKRVSHTSSFRLRPPTDPEPTAPEPAGTIVGWTIAGAVIGTGSQNCQPGGGCGHCGGGAQLGGGSQPGGGSGQPGGLPHAHIRSGIAYGLHHRWERLVTSRCRGPKKALARVPPVCFDMGDRSGWGELGE